jgi:DUF1680 family protein
VNGKAASIALQPGTWAELEREWRDGDRIDFTIDMPLRLKSLDDRHPNLVALLHGPVALFAIEPGASAMTQKQMLQAQKIGSSPDWEVTTEQGKVRMKSFPGITNEGYRLYQDTV